MECLPLRSEGNHCTGKSHVFRDERKRGFLNAEGADNPLRSPISQETIVRARHYRLSRMRMAGVLNRTWLFASKA